MTARVVAEPERRGRTRLPSGRHLGWSEWGPADGRPVLFCPGAGASSRLGFGADVLERLGARLIGLDRPGLGQSDPSPGRELIDWAADVVALQRARALSSPVIVGFSQGAPFALACAARGDVSAAAIVSGGDEIAAPAHAPALPDELRALVEQAASDPDGAEAMFRQLNAAQLHAMVRSMTGDADRPVYSEPDFNAALRRAMEEGFAQGADGYARDTLLAMRPWSFDPAEITVPVHLWYGELDTSPVHSPDLGLSLAARIPGARRTVVPGAGGAILWTEAERILADLLAHRGARDESRA